MRIMSASLAGWLCLAASHASAADPATVWPTKAWDVSTPEEQGVDSAALAQLINKVGTFRQDSLLIVRHGKIIVDAYYAPYAAGIEHDLRSVTKSIIGTLTAIELREGLLDSVDHPIVDLFADKNILNLDDNKKAMSVQSLLDMTSGIDWREKAYTPDETIWKMYLSPDRTEFVLTQPMAHVPGTVFYYNSGNPYVLSALINKRTGRNAFDFARTELFGPLGITKVHWGTVDAQGVTDGESKLFLTPHDMAKIGYLYLHHGAWDGSQIVPPSWVDRVKEGKTEAVSGFHYANLWWSIPEKGAFMAMGRHSQLILVLPAQDIIAVMTGVMQDGEYYRTAGLIDDIAGSVRSEDVLPVNSTAQSSLVAAIQAAATERPSPVGDTPELAKSISGKFYQLDDNRMHVKTVSLNFGGPEPSWAITMNTGRPEYPVERLTGLVGLDGLFHVSPPDRFGIAAAKASWINDHTLLIDRRILGHGETQRWTLIFGGKQLELNFENTDGLKARLHGEASD
jgi:CubicO group peptidase (beta-lactamase class C family)